MNPTELINDLLKRSDGSLDRLKLHYVMYDILELEDGYIVDSWFNYIHQRSQFQFPVKSAMEHEMTSSFSNGTAFQIVQTALQFTTHGDIPGLT